MVHTGDICWHLRLKVYTLSHQKDRTVPFSSQRCDDVGIQRPTRCSPGRSLRITACWAARSSSREAPRSFCTSLVPCWKWTSFFPVKTSFNKAPGSVEGEESKIPDLLQLLSVATQTRRFPPVENYFIACLVNINRKVNAAVLWYTIAPLWHLFCTGHRCCNGSIVWKWGSARRRRWQDVLSELGLCSSHAGRPGSHWQGLLVVPFVKWFQFKQL